MHARAPLDTVEVMDVLCDDIVEEILLRLPAKCLPRLRAVSHRYNALVLSPDFAARHWQRHSPYLSGGVFLHRTLCLLTAPPPPPIVGGPLHNWESVSCFLASSSTLSSAEAEPAFSAANLASFLPSPSEREAAYLQRVGGTDSAGSIVIVHSSAGLLLCCRSHVRPVHYYVCDPVALRWVALPELPRPSPNEQSGLLSVAADACGGDGGGSTTAIERFQVVLFDQRRQWEIPGGSLDLEVFSSGSGEWTAMRLPYPPAFGGFLCFAPPFLTQSGTAAYWLGFCPRDKAVAYSSVDHSLRLIPVPGRAHDISALNRCIGERRGGGIRYAHFDASEFEVWDSSSKPGGDGLPQWTLVHRAAMKDVVPRSPGAAAFVWSSCMLRWIAISPEAMWCSFFTLMGFDPADEDVFFFEALTPGPLGAYSMRLRKLSLRCQLVPGVSFAPFGVFPYVRQPPRPVQH